MEQQLAVNAKIRWETLQPGRDKFIRRDDELWMCKWGHRFRYFNRLECPCCSSSKGERAYHARAALRYGVQNVQKDYIGLAEYDIVIPGIAAIEYNGEQHYKRCMMTPDLTYRTALDTYKRELATKHGVRLLVMPWNEPDENLKLFNALPDEGITTWTLHTVHTSVAHLRPATGPCSLPEMEKIWRKSATES